VNAFFSAKPYPQVLWYFLGTLVVCGVILFLLHQLPSRSKRAMIWVTTFLGGAIFLVDFLLPPDPVTEKNALATTTELIGRFAQVVVGMTILLGVYNLCRIHFNNIRRRRPGFYNSGVFFAFFVAMLVACFWRGWPEWFNEEYRPPAWIRVPEGADGVDLYTLLFNGLLLSLEATMFSILAFYIVSAAYRAFRVRSAEAGLLMITAAILMLGQVGVGVLLTHWIPPESAFAGLRIENVSQWVLTTINAPVQRAIGFGLGLGALAMSLRIWLSLERGSYFGQEV